MDYAAYDYQNTLQNAERSARQNIAQLSDILWRRDSSDSLSVHGSTGSPRPDWLMHDGESIDSLSAVASLATPSHSNRFFAVNLPLLEDADAALHDLVASEQPDLIGTFHYDNLLQLFWQMIALTQPHQPAARIAALLIRQAAMAKQEASEP